MHPLHGKVVLITGGSSGIGRATALRLASFGVRIAVASRTAEALEEVVQQAKTLGVEALAVPTDVTDIEQCRHAVETTVAAYRPVWMCCCARRGVSMRGMFADAEPAALEHIMRVNFFGTLYPTYFAVPHVKRSHGSLVAISSLTGKRGTPSYAIYGASKFAVRGLYDSLRLELADDGVHVGVVSPGFVDTPLRERVLDASGRPWTRPPCRPSASGRWKNASIGSCVSSSNASRRRCCLASSDLCWPSMKSPAAGSATGISAANSTPPMPRLPKTARRVGQRSDREEEGKLGLRLSLHETMIAIDGQFLPLLPLVIGPDNGEPADLR